MEWRKQPHLLLMVFLFFVVNRMSYALATETVASNVFRKDVTNLQFYEDHIYVAGDGVLYQIANTSKSRSTCKGIAIDNCEIVTKILVSNQTNGQLLLCGSANIERCLVGHFDNLTPLSNVDARQEAMTKADDSGSVTIDIKYENGDVVYNDGNFPFRYPLSTWDPWSGNGEELLNYLALTLEGENGNSITVLYKASIQTAGMNFILSNQKKGDKTVTKLVRICKKNTQDNIHDDVVLKCTKDNTNFNLLQNAAIIDRADVNDKLFVGTFQTESGHSAICVARISQFIDVIKRDSEATCEDIYNIRDWRSCLHKSNSSICMDHGTDQRDNTHETQIELTPIFNVTKENGFITKVASTVATDNNTLIIMAGTSKGRISKLRVHANDSDVSAEVFEQTTVRLNSSVRAIDVRGSHQYVLTRKRLDKQKVANCSRYQTCEETNNGNNPYCGWCVLQSKSTRKSECSNTEYWIPSGQPCIQIQDLEDIPADGSEREIQFTVNQINLENLADSLYCKLKNSSKASVYNNRVECNITVPTEHTSATFELTSDETVLAASNILFYKCSEFHQCGKCTEARGQEKDSGCVWSTENLSCVDKSSWSDMEVNNGTDCPQLEGNHGTFYIPNGVAKSVTLQAKNLPESDSDFRYTCMACGTQFEATATSSNITCNFKLETSASEQVCQIIVLYETKNTQRYLDEDFISTVTVYQCEGLAHDCTHCTALNKTRYTCQWCRSSCKYNSDTCHETCPPPSLTKIEPNTSTPKGGTLVTIDGFDLSSTAVWFGEKGVKDCEYVFNSAVEIGRFETNVTDKIICQAPEVSNEIDVYISVGNAASQSQLKFSYRTPVISRITPSFGPVAGGTLVTLFGKNFEIGNKKILVRFNNAFNFGDCNVNRSSEYFLVCLTSASKSLNSLKNIQIAIDRGSDSTYEYKYEDNENLAFNFVSNPEINSVHPNKCILSGGLPVTVNGTDLTNALQAFSRVIYDGQENIDSCVFRNKSQVICKCPVAPNSVQSDLKILTDSATSKRRRKRDTDEEIKVDFISVEILVELDNFKKSFSYSYFPDPFFDSYSEVKIFESDETVLVLSGTYLNLVAEKEDIIIKVGIDTCSVVELSPTNLTCVTSRTDKYDTDHQEVRVEVGNYHQRLGYVRFKYPNEVNIYVIGGSVGGALAVIVIVAVFAVIKLRRRGLIAKQLTDKLHNLEHEMRTVAKEDFCDLNLKMSGVNRNLVEQGFPYHGYLEFASNICFASEYIHITTIKIKAKVGSERIKSGMETFEKLLCNKFFLQPLLLIMEKQKKFFLLEKANFVGHLCQVMMGKMEYLDDIIQWLIQKQVQDATKRKQQKSMFKRCESITEHLLNNWLYLCLYHHIKADTGSPLYLLHVVMQETMESGPIDDVTGDAKFTLCKDRLLKKWRSTAADDKDEVSFEAKTLNLRVIVDNGDMVYDCKALDCDTITRVKRKCLRQIYVNYPASQLAVDATELKLNLHGGASGFLTLADKDLTSTREGGWIRLNTLAHFNVPNDANMSLVDPKYVDTHPEEVYENPGGVIREDNPTQNAEEENFSEKTWHLVRPKSSDGKQEDSATDDLYLSRLTTTKQSVVKYMTDLFDVILSQDRCPAPVKRIFDLFDSLEATYKLDTDTVHTWKSHSYLIRVWGSLMADPSRLFDINVPPYVESSLGVASQVFIDACSQTSTDVTKDTSPQKLIFMKEVKQYKEKISNFFKDVKAGRQSQEEMRQYLDVVNKLQKQQNFPKTSSLHKIYDQLKPYMDTIIDELSQNKEASSLLLNQKLSDLVELMEGDM